ncbi:uncharacterized protein LOC132201748 [Neocloeon triangulifer]|uniref:uncharacterized protein LOC132201748 n=1 Tax=Neocloeon triangulifer TaxID=2078957 RepID=UPI00286F79C1|nr:uncharacterized protein LOC132201748 [Neocloeon triangulifer]
MSKENFDQPLSFYRKMAELQERLRQLEEERSFIAEKYTKLVKSRRKRNGEMITQLKEEYARFLEHDRQRKMRTENIMASLENIDQHTAIIHTKTEHLKEMRRQYDAYMTKLHPKVNLKHSSTKENFSTPNFSRFQSRPPPPPQWHTPFAGNYKLSDTQSSFKPQLNSSAARYTDPFATSANFYPSSSRGYPDPAYQQPSTQSQDDDLLWRYNPLSRSREYSDRLEPDEQFEKLSLNLDKVLDLSEKPKVPEYKMPDDFGFLERKTIKVESTIKQPVLSPYAEEKLENNIIVEETADVFVEEEDIRVATSIFNKEDPVFKQIEEASALSDVADTVTQDVTLTPTPLDYVESVGEAHAELEAESLDSKKNEMQTILPSEVEHKTPYLINSDLHEQASENRENFENYKPIEAEQKFEHFPVTNTGNLQYENEAINLNNQPEEIIPAEQYYSETPAPNLTSNFTPEDELQVHYPAEPPVQYEPPVPIQYEVPQNVYQEPYHENSAQMYEPVTSNQQNSHMYGNYEESSESSAVKSEPQMYQQQQFNSPVPYNADGFREMELEPQPVPYTYEQTPDYSIHEANSTSLSQSSSQREVLDERVSIQSVSQASASDEVEQQMTDILKHAPTPNRPPAPPGKKGISPSSSWSKLKNLGATGALRTRPGSPSSNSSKSSSGSKKSSPNRSPTSSSTSRSPSARRSNVNK